MTLGELINTLETLPANAPVKYLNGHGPGKLCSWRGAYEDLTLPSGDGKVTVKEMLKDARAAVGATFQGYKGGDYVMDLDTAVWADDWGEYQRQIPTGFVIEGSGKDRQVRIHTMEMPSEYRW